jgi:hypothetical protein
MRRRKNIKDARFYSYCTNNMDNAKLSITLHALGSDCSAFDLSSDEVTFCHDDLDVRYMSVPVPWSRPAIQRIL